MAKIDEAVNAVWAAIDADPSYVTNLTRRLVQIPSVNPKFVDDPTLNRESDVQALIRSELASIGMSIDKWDVFPNRPNIIGQLAGSEERSLLLCGHIDVVPVGSVESWTVEPFGGEIRDGRIYGRGAYDMKGGIAAAIGAMRAIRSAGVELQGRVSIHSVVDEEAGGFGAIEAIRRGHGAKAALVTEPSDGNIHVCVCGHEWIRVTITGRSGHAAHRYAEIWPQADGPGRLRRPMNAIDIAARFLDVLRDFESSRCLSRQHPLLPPGINTINVASIRGGSGLGPDGLPLTMSNPAIIPDIAVIDLMYSFLPNQRREDIRSEFEDFVHQFCRQDPWLQENPIRLEWELGDFHIPPMDTSPEHPIVRSAFNRRTQSYGRNWVTGPIRRRVDLAWS